VQNQDKKGQWVSIDADHTPLFITDVEAFEGKLPRLSTTVKHWLLRVKTATIAKRGHISQVWAQSFLL
jgi:hypothetical protein